MKTPDERTTDGQAAVHVAVLMVVLLMAVALAVDIGHVLQRRRQMQNAADAGALAGAYDICFGDPTRTAAQTRSDARVAAVIDARANGADKAVATFPMDWTVNVTTTEKADTFFLNIIGMDHVDLGAAARAACGMAKSGCGLWPITIDADRYNELYDNGQGCEDGGTEFFVWSGDNINNAPDCTLNDCDVDNDGISDVIDSQNRAYVDFSLNVSADYPDPCSQDGCGAAELTCWILNDSGGKVTLPSCIAGTSGVIAAVKDDVETRIGHAVAIPLYESVDDCDAPVCPGGHAYWITKFACINVLGWYHNLELEPIPPNDNKWKGKVIRASINCSLSCGTYCGGTAGQPPDPSGLRAVSLVR